jgi:hypothetical protein
MGDSYLPQERLVELCALLFLGPDQLRENICVLTFRIFVVNIGRARGTNVGHRCGCLLVVDRLPRFGGLLCWLKRSRNPLRSIMYAHAYSPMHLQVSGL